VIAVVITWPFVSALWYSLHSIYTPTLESHWVGFDNYARLIASREFWHAFGVTVTWTTAVLVVQLLAGIGFALLLNESFFGRNLARGAILFPYFVSTVVAVLVWRWLFNDLYGLINLLLVRAGIVDMPLNWLGEMPNAMISVVLVGAWKHFPFVVLAVLARLQTIPGQLYEAAMLDGAGPVSRFFDVTLPQLRDVLIVVILLRVIWDFKEFDLIFLLTSGGPVNATETLPLVIYRQAFGLNTMGQAAATSVALLVVLAFVMAAYLAYTRPRREDRT
jgi:multiple sugar transport system permease protein